MWSLLMKGDLTDSEINILPIENIDLYRERDMEVGEAGNYIRNCRAFSRDREEARSPKTIKEAPSKKASGKIS